MIYNISKNFVPKNAQNWIFLMRAWTLVSSLFNFPFFSNGFQCPVHPQFCIIFLSIVKLVLVIKQELYVAGGLATTNQSISLLHLAIFVLDSQTYTLLPVHLFSIIYIFKFLLLFTWMYNYWLSIYFLII
jgi:hypothetical protein